MTFVQLYFSIEGRISRSTYWFTAIVPYLIFYLIAILIYSATRIDHILHVIFNLIFWLMITATTIKRLHDRDKSAWWFFLFFIPIIGQIWALIELGFLGGTVGKNRFGPDPVV